MESRVESRAGNTHTCVLLRFFGSCDPIRDLPPPLTSTISGPAWGGGASARSSADRQHGAEAGHQEGDTLEDPTVQTSAKQNQRKCVCIDCDSKISVKWFGHGCKAVLRTLV